MPDLPKRGDRVRVTEARSTLTYAFGALAPESRTDREYVIDEIRRATRYKNALIASHRAERERYGIAKRFGVFPDTDDWIAGLREHYRAQRREIRANCGLGWGTYLMVEQDVKAAIRSKGELSFHRYDGNGRVGAAVPTANGDKQRVTGSRREQCGESLCRGCCRMNLSQTGSQVRGVFAHATKRVTRQLEAYGTRDELSSRRFSCCPFTSQGSSRPTELETSSGAARSHKAVRCLQKPGRGSRL